MNEKLWKIFACPSTEEGMTNGWPTRHGGDELRLWRWKILRRACSLLPTDQKPSWSSNCLRSNRDNESDPGQTLSSSSSAVHRNNLELPFVWWSASIAPWQDVELCIAIECRQSRSKTGIYYIKLFSPPGHPLPPSSLQVPLLLAIQKNDLHFATATIVRLRSREWWRRQGSLFAALYCHWSAAPPSQCNQSGWIGRSSSESFSGQPTGSACSLN